MTSSLAKTRQCPVVARVAPASTALPFNSSARISRDQLKLPSMTLFRHAMSTEPNVHGARMRSVQRVSTRLHGRRGDK